MKFVKALTIILALVLCVGFLHAGTVQDKEVTARVSQEQLAHAKIVFGEKCARCHGIDGRRNTRIGQMLGAPDFTNERWWKTVDDDKRLVESVTNGKDEMPAFGKKLTKQEIVALVAYVHFFNKPGPTSNR